MATNLSPRASEQSRAGAKPNEAHFMMNQPNGERYIVTTSDVKETASKFDKLSSGERTVAARLARNPGMSWAEAAQGTGITEQAFQSAMQRVGLHIGGQDGAVINGVMSSHSLTPGAMLDSKLPTHYQAAMLPHEGNRHVYVGSVVDPQGNVMHLSGPKGEELVGANGKPISMAVIPGGEIHDLPHHVNHPPMGIRLNHRIPANVIARVGGKLAGAAAPLAVGGMMAASGANAAEVAHEMAEVTPGANVLSALGDGRYAEAAIRAGETVGSLASAIPVAGTVVNAAVVGIGDVARLGAGALGADVDPSLIGAVASAVTQGPNIELNDMAVAAERDRSGEGVRLRTEALERDRQNQAIINSPEAAAALQQLDKLPADASPELRQRYEAVMQAQATMQTASPVSQMGQDFSPRQQAEMAFNSAVAQFVQTANGKDAPQPAPHPMDKLKDDPALAALRANMAAFGVQGQDVDHGTKAPMSAVAPGQRQTQAALG